MKTQPATPDEAERDLIRQQRDELLKVLQEIADHHEAQRELWSSEENADADQASYHEERRDFAIAAITKATGGDV